MALNDIIVKALTVADSITASLQANISLTRWEGDDGFGGVVNTEGALTVASLIDQQIRQRTLRNGRIVTTQATVTILRPLAANGASGRIEPIDPRDRIVLPDGATGPIVDTEGLLNPDTSRPYFGTVYLGISPTGG